MVIKVGSGFTFPDDTVQTTAPTPDNVTDTYIPIKDGITFADSPMRLEDGILKSNVTITFPSASILIGDNVKITDAGSAGG